MRVSVHLQREFRSSYKSPGPSFGSRNVNGSIGITMTCMRLQELTELRAVGHRPVIRGYVRRCLYIWLRLTRLHHATFLGRRVCKTFHAAQLGDDCRLEVTALRSRSIERSRSRASEAHARWRPRLSSHCPSCPTDGHSMCEWQLVLQWEPAWPAAGERVVEKASSGRR